VRIGDRVTIPVTSLSRLHTAITAAGVAITGVDVNGNVQPGNLQAAAQPTINAFDATPAADATYAAQQQKAAATAGIDNGQTQSGDKEERLVRALALVVLDEINLIRANFTPAMTARTTAQVVSAIKAKIAATAE
jgi:hypothetical protein